MGASPKSPPLLATPAGLAGQRPVPHPQAVGHAEGPTKEMPPPVLALCELRAPGFRA